MDNVYGYVRVSGQEQNVARQINALKNFGVDERNIFIDKCFGTDFNRPAYKEMISKLQANDTVVVQSIDRFGRNYRDNIAQVDIIKNTKKANFVVIDSPIIDTRKDLGIDSDFLLDVSIMIDSNQAEKEYHYLHQRQVEGIEIAKKRGVHCGHPYKAKSENLMKFIDSGKAAKSLLVKLLIC